MKKRALDALLDMQEKLERCEREEKNLQRDDSNDGVCSRTQICTGASRGQQGVSALPQTLLKSGKTDRTRQLSQDHEEGGVPRRCVGAFGLEVPQLYTGTLDDGDMLLLCTDGFYKKAPPDFFGSACTRNGKQGNCIGG